MIATCSTPAKAKVARACGADEVVLYNQVDFREEVSRLTAGQGVAAVFDGVGASTFKGSLQCLARRGTLVLYG